MPLSILLRNGHWILTAGESLADWDALKRDSQHGWITTIDPADGLPVGIAHAEAAFIKPIPQDKFDEDKRAREKAEEERKAAHKTDADVAAMDRERRAAIDRMERAEAEVVRLKARKWWQVWRRA